LSKTPEGYYQVEGGIDYAIAKSLAAAPFADLIWMETKTANLADAKVFAKAIHAKYPDQMLAYNLSPSFSWDTTGMSEAEMQVFPEELGKLGYVFNFITYGGHQVDGLAGEEFATALMEDGMLALARLQRKFRLLNSPYKTPQSHVGGPRIDAALMATTGRTATTKAMGKGSTQFQHLVQTEVPISLLNNWLGLWTGHNQISLMLQVSLRPHHSGSDLLELNVLDEDNNKIADVIFDTIKDRRGRNILSIRDINNYEKTFRKKRLMTLLQLFLIHRYAAVATHYLSPTDDNQKQAEGMKSLTIYEQVNTEIGDIIVATVNTDHIKDLLNPINEALMKLISKT
jgi:isocitrate lyase